MSRQRGPITARGKYMNLGGVGRSPGVTLEKVGLRHDENRRGTASSSSRDHCRACIAFRNSFSI